MEVSFQQEKNVISSIRICPNSLLLWIKHTMKETVCVDNFPFGVYRLYCKKKVSRMIII